MKKICNLKLMAINNNNLIVNAKTKNKNLSIIYSTIINK